MGIQGLIPFLDKGSSRINIAQYRGCCVAVDAYCWLHKGAYTCAEKLAKGEKCDAYVYYCMKYVNMLLSHNIKPILVFDGRYLPAKAGTEKKRRESRAVNRKTATELLNAGRIDEARNYLRRCVDVTHAMALALIQECRKINVDCIVAPYEADAQLAYLNLQNIAQVVITEDSDLVLFGCSKIVFKLDLQGCGLLVERERLHLSMGVRAENFSFDSFRYMCILSGCDYLPSLPGIGLNKALKFINKTKDPDIHRALRRMPSYLNMTQLRVSDEYRDSFITADATFRYQPVFDPRSRSLVPLTEPPDGEDPPAIVDERLPQDVAFNLALGNLDPFTLKEVDNFNPDCRQQGVASLQRKSWGPSFASTHPSIWSQDFPGFQPAPRNDRFPGMLNCSAVLDVTPLRVSKGPLAVETVGENGLPSSTELESMYGSSGPALPQPKRQCLSPRKTMIDLSLAEPSASGSPECSSGPTSVSSSEDKLQLQSPSSPILSQRKSKNPFAKPKQISSTGLGPPGAMGRPNYFSALRKFDGIYPMEADSDVIVASRYFRSSGLADKRSIDPEKQDVLKDVSNTNPKVLAQNNLDEETILDGYSCDKENSCETSSPEDSSVLTEMEVIQSKANLPSQSSYSKDVPKAQQDKKYQELRIVEKINVDIKEENDISRKEKNNISVRNSASSFNWSQFTCRKSVSASKLTSSQAVSQTFKNPFRKKCVSKYSGTLERDCREVKGTGDSTSGLASIAPQKILEVDLGGEELPVSSESSCAANLSGDDIFEHSQDELQQELKVSSDLDQSTTAVRLVQEVAAPTIMKNELGPSEDTLWWQQHKETEAEDEDEESVSWGSCDSGYQGSQDTPKTGNHCTPGSGGARSRGTPNGRRLGLGRALASSQVTQKQNLLAQYGFSKKRKLTH